MNKIIDLSKRKNKLDSTKTLTPLLSIVIPAYNASEYLDETIYDLLVYGNSYIEIIIINDGSHDSTLEVAQKLSNKHNNIRVYSQKNLGAGIARNNALKYCNGVFLFFLDADDKVNVVELFKATKKALGENADLVFLPYELLYISTNKIEKMYPSDENLFKAGSRVKHITEQRRIASGLTGFPWNRLISRDLMFSQNIMFGTTPVHNDIRFHWHSICCAQNIIFHDRVACTHKKFESGSLSSYRGEGRLTVFQAINETYESISPYTSFRDSLDIWIDVVNKMLDWNLKIINKDLKELFKLKTNEFIKNKDWNKKLTES